MQQPPYRNPIGTPFIELQSVDSTNNYAREQIPAGLAQHGTAVFAHEQTAGKGQRGRVWTSEKGSNIALSVMVKPQPLLVSQQFQLSAAMALAVRDFFSKYSVEDASIKWPNDLYWQDRKAGGILIESIIGSRGSGTAEWEWAIVGVGININQTSFPPHLPNPVSLKQITGNDHQVPELAKELCGFMEKYLQELTRSGFENIYEKYNRHLYKRNETVRLKKDNRSFDVMIKRISPAGKLVVQHSIEEEFDFGEVEWVI